MVLTDFSPPPLNSAVLFLSSNSFEGNIPDIVARLGDTLEGLYLSDNGLQGFIPTAVCALGELSKFKRGCKFPESLSFCFVSSVSRVFVITEALFLDANKLTGAIPSCVGTLTNLHQLYVFDNELNGTLPDGLEELTSLRKSTLHLVGLWCCL